MKRIASLAAFALLLALPLGAQLPAGAERPDAPIRFRAVDVVIDAGEQPLAAWQFELAAETGDAKIVGIEGGEHPAFAQPPYYDPAALANHRVIIAAFNTGRDLPVGKTRVARLHVQITGQAEPEYAVRLEAAASPTGERIAAATITLAKGEPK